MTDAGGGVRSGGKQKERWRIRMRDKKWKRPFSGGERERKRRVRATVGRREERRKRCVEERAVK